jgi:hypothetical protein
VTGEKEALPFHRFRIGEDIARITALDVSLMGLLFLQSLQAKALSGSLVT